MTSTRPNTLSFVPNRERSKKRDFFRFFSLPSQTRIIFIVPHIQDVTSVGLLTYDTTVRKSWFGISKPQHSLGPFAAVSRISRLPHAERSPLAKSGAAAHEGHVGSQAANLVGEDLQRAHRVSRA